MGFLGLSVLELGLGKRQTDRRTDRHRPSFYNAPLYRGHGITGSECTVLTATGLVNGEWQNRNP